MVKIYGECKTEEIFVEICFSKFSRNFFHKQGRSEVIKIIMKEKSIGIIDEDPGKNQPSILKKQLNIKPIFENRNIKIYELKQTSSKLLQISPDFEGWLVYITKQLNIKLKDYSLPENPKALHKEINLNIKKLKEVLNDIYVNGKSFFTEMESILSK